MQFFSRRTLTNNCAILVISELSWLFEQLEKVLSTNHPEPAVIEKAKRVLKVKAVTKYIQPATTLFIRVKPDGNFVFAGA